jgi:Tyrosine phosphatase family
MASGEEERRSGPMPPQAIRLPPAPGPRDEQIATVLTLLNHAASGPVFVHCKRGADRTGIVVPRQGACFANRCGPPVPEVASPSQVRQTVISAPDESSKPR